MYQKDIQHCGQLIQQGKESVLYRCYITVNLITMFCVYQEKMFYRYTVCRRNIQSSIYTKNFSLSKWNVSTRLYDLVKHTCQLIHILWVTPVKKLIILKNHRYLRLRVNHQPIMCNSGNLEY